MKSALFRLAERTQGDRLFAPTGSTGPAIQVSPDDTVTVLKGATPYSSRSDEARQSLDRLRGNLAPAASRGVPATRSVADWSAHLDRYAEAAGQDTRRGNA